MARLKKPLNRPLDPKVLRDLVPLEPSETGVPRRPGRMPCRSWSVAGSPPGGPPVSWELSSAIR